MTTVKIEKGTGWFHILVDNHCDNRDVCVSVSAIVNTLLQYTRFFCENRFGIISKEKDYKSGRVELDVRATEAVMHDYFKGAQAILIGFELYEANFPEELKVES